MNFARVIDGVVVAIAPRPRWFTDAGEPVSDARLAQEGWLPVRREPPAASPWSHAVSERPSAEWTVEASEVAVTYAVEPLPVGLQIEAFRAAVSQHVDATAQSRDYDNAVSLASYVASTNATYAAEAQAFVAWRDAVWADVIQRLNAVQAGTQASPESPAALIADLPQISWPT